MNMSDDNPLRKFIKDMDPQKNWPENFRESPIWKDGHTRGHQTGYMLGLQDAWQEANTVINSVRNIIELHDRRMREDEFAE